MGHPWQADHESRIAHHPNAVSAASWQPVGGGCIAPWGPAPHGARLRPAGGGPRGCTDAAEQRPSPQRDPWQRRGGACTAGVLPGAGRVPGRCPQLSVAGRPLVVGWPLSAPVDPAVHVRHVAAAPLPPGHLPPVHAARQVSNVRPLALPASRVAWPQPDVSGHVEAGDCPAAACWDAGTVTFPPQERPARGLEAPRNSQVGRARLPGLLPPPGHGCVPAAPSLLLPVRAAGAGAGARARGNDAPVRHGVRCGPPAPWGPALGGWGLYSGPGVRVVWGRAGRGGPAAHAAGLSAAISIG
jgi:hypothetical protein